MNMKCLSFVLSIVLIELYFPLTFAQPTNGLIAYYTFNGNANDYSGNGNHGTTYGGLNWGEDRFGNTVSCALFDGVDDYILVDNSSSFPENAITIAYWINRQSINLTTHENYISKEHAFQSYIYDSDKKFWTGFWLGSPGAWLNFSSGNFSVPISNQWLFYAFSYDNQDKIYKSYINGTLVNQDATNDPNAIIRTSSFPMYIGRNGSASVYYINGLLDDLRIYDRVLSITEVLELYHESSNPGTNSVQVLRPNGYESLAHYQDYRITWDSEGNFNSFEVDFSTDWGITWVNIEDNLPASQNFYDWTVWNVLSGNCRIKITGNPTQGLPVSDESNYVFTITAPGILFDDFSYSYYGDKHISDNNWVIVDTFSGPPYSYSPYKKEMVSFEDDQELAGNRLLILSTQVTEFFNELEFSRIETNSETKFLEGSYFARVKFDHNPVSFSDGNVETFYAINADDDPPTDWSECDFEYLPYDVWDNNHNSSMWLNTWYSNGENNSDRDKASTDTDLSYFGWNLLNFEVLDGENVVYYINNSHIATHNLTPNNNLVYPNNPMQISFANWVAGDEFGNYYIGNNPSTRETLFKVDYVLFFDEGESSSFTNKVFIDSIEAFVSQLRAAGITYTNTTMDDSVTNVENQNISQTDIIKDYILNQNYPNPFNPKTTIKYQIPELNFVTLKVYDVLGNEIATLINEERTAGSYEVKFDGSNLSSGIYFYRMRAGTFTDIKKIILIK